MATRLHAFHLTIAVIVILSTATRGDHEGPSTGIGLLHMHDNANFYQELGELSWKNKMRYAKRHGYDLISHTPAGTSGLLKQVDCEQKSEDTVRRNGKCYSPHQQEYKNDARAATFGKIKLARAACVGRENWWLLWSDADAVIVNQTRRLEDIIDDRFDMMVTVDWLMLNAGVFLMKCSPWFQNFLKEVYEKRSFDEAKALDQSAFQWHIDNIKGVENHIKYVPKWVLNVYPEEYRPGDFLVHLAGKLYEATVPGCTALARQFDVFAQVDDVRGISAFFSTRYILNQFSGTCTTLQNEYGKDCPPEDDRRLKLDAPLAQWNTPNRYLHVGQRYYWLHNWKDKYDVPDWNKGRKQFVLSTHSSHSEGRERVVQAEGGNVSDDASCEQNKCKAPGGSQREHEEL